jgi:hypothetical protein
MENNYQNPPANQPQEEPVVKKYTKATHPAERKPSTAKTLLAIVGLIGFFGLGMAGVLVSQKQYVSKAPVAPNVPESRPKAQIQQSSCTLAFTVSEPELLACGEVDCDTDDDCENGLTCITADDGKNYCADPAFEDACADDPSVINCCEEPAATPTPTGTITPTPTATPTPTPELLACGDQGCSDNFDCASGLICVTADNGNNYCGEPDYKSACADNPSDTNCCTKPGEETTPTPTFVLTTTGDQPELPEELLRTGPEDWLRYLQAGLATLGVGALLLLLL